jgi:hypothetical protein
MIDAASGPQLLDTVRAGFGLDPIKISSNWLGIELYEPGIIIKTSVKYVCNCVLALLAASQSG